MLNELEHLKPLWDFMIAVGTVALAALSLWLAVRKPKAALRVVATRVGNLQGDLAQILVRNVGAAAVAVERCFWRARGRDLEISLPEFGERFGGPVRPLPEILLARGDRVFVRMAISSWGDGISRAVGAEASDQEIAGLMQGSEIVLVTTTDERFATPLPQDIREALQTHLARVRPGHM